MGEGGDQNVWSACQMYTELGVGVWCGWVSLSLASSRSPWVPVVAVPVSTWPRSSCTCTPTTESMQSPRRPWLAC